MNTIDLDFVATSYNAPDSNVDSTEYDVTNETNVYIYNVSGRYNGMVCYEFPHNSFSTERIMATVVLDNDFSFNSNHEYNLSFSYAGYVSLPLSCVCQLTFYDSSGNVIKEQYLYNVTHEKNDAPNIFNVDIDFKPDISDIEGGYKCVLQMGFVQNGFNSDTIYQRFFVSPTISLTDKDDDSGWFQKILNKINDVWESIKSLPDKIGVYIQQIATDITDGLKSLFVPEDGFFDAKKQEMETFLEEHFGVIFTAPNILITIIEKLLTVEVSEPIISFPKIQFDLLGTEYSLIDKEIHLNLSDFVGDGSPYHILYKFYRAFATGFLIVAFANYCKNKYDYLFGKDGEAV